jgi:hypothetical protein
MWDKQQKAQAQQQEHTLLLPPQPQQVQQLPDGQ